MTPGVVMTDGCGAGPGLVPTPALQAMRQGTKALHALQAGTAAMQEVVPIAVKPRFPQARTILYQEAAPCGSLP
jgi:hypothetical protein